MSEVGQKQSELIKKKKKKLKFHPPDGEGLR